MLYTSHYKFSSFLSYIISQNGQIICIEKAAERWIAKCNSLCLIFEAYGKLFVNRLKRVGERFSYISISDPYASGGGGVRGGSLKSPFSLQKDLIHHQLAIHFKCPTVCKWSTSLAVIAWESPLSKRAWLQLCTMRIARLWAVYAAVMKDGHKYACNNVAFTGTRQFTRSSIHVTWLSKCIIMWTTKIGCNTLQAMYQLQLCFCLKIASEAISNF